MFDRDELAARLAVALAGRSDQFSSISLADDAVTAADALLARLAAPVADAAPRPEWVPNVGDEYVATVVGTASPAAYVPQAGDVVRPRDGGDERVIVTNVVDDLLFGYSLTGPMGETWPVARYCREYNYDRASTTDERRGSGLPTDAPGTYGAATPESAVVAGALAPAPEREGLAKALREAELGAEHCSRFPWAVVGAGERVTYLWRADAAIAFLKANGGAR